MYLTGKRSLTDATHLTAAGATPKPAVTDPKGHTCPVTPPSTHLPIRGSVAERSIPVFCQNMAESRSGSPARYAIVPLDCYLKVLYVRGKQPVSKGCQQVRPTLGLGEVDLDGVGGGPGFDIHLRAIPVHTPVRYAIYPWITTVTQGSTASVEGAGKRSLTCIQSAFSLDTPPAFPKPSEAQGCQAAGEPPPCSRSVGQAGSRDLLI